MLDNGNDKDWFNSSVIAAAAVVSLVSLTFLIPWELTDAHPVVELQLFRRRNFRVGTHRHRHSLFRTIRRQHHLSAVVADHRGYTATWAGLAVAPVGLLALLASPIVGRNMNRMNLRWRRAWPFACSGRACSGSRP